MVGLLILFSVAGAIAVAMVSFGVYHQLTRPRRCTYAMALARGMATELSQIGLYGEQITITHDDDTTTPCWLIEGACDDPQAPIVVMTHGWASGRYAMLPMAKLFTPYVSRVAIYDLRGQGESTAKVTTLGQLEPGDLVNVMRHAQRAGEDRPFVLFGTSLGAAISLAAAYRLATGGNNGDDEAASHRVVGLVLEGIFESPMGAVGNRLRLMRLPAQPFVAIVHWILRRRYRQGDDWFNGTRMAAATDCPMLFIHGRHDRVCPIAEARRVAAGADDSTFVEIPDGHHSRLVEVDTDRYVHAIDSFMRKIGCGEPVGSTTVGEGSSSGPSSQCSSVLGVARSNHP